VMAHEAKKKGPSKNKEWENKLAASFERFQLPRFTRQFVLVRLHQDPMDPRKDGKPRVWQYDFCFEEFKLIVEFDGGIWMPGGGAHSHPVDVERNTDKRNDAVFSNYWLLAFTDKHVRSGDALRLTQRKLMDLGWRPASDDDE
jgi:hypothetical protein